MSEVVEQTNRALEDHAPTAAQLLSPLGRRCALPPDIPVQAAEARGKTYNGTIGQITDGAGKALPLPSMARCLEALPDADFHSAFLYSPVPGLREVRDRWRAWQRGQAAAELGENLPASSLPIVTVGLAHGLSVVADLFAGEGRTLALPLPFWGNYRQVFDTRTGAKLVGAPGYTRESNGSYRYNPTAIEQALEAAHLPEGEPALALLNLPSNPGGYSLTVQERAEVKASLLRVADQRPLLVICDDAYAGLVYEEEIPRASMFWELAGVHEQLVPVKVDGATKEFSFFGGRVGFLTFPFEPDSPAAEALGSKVAGLSRATIGSPVAASQVLLLQALRGDTMTDEVEAVRQVLAERYRVLRDALAGVDPELLQVLPFNSGCFALTELPPSLDLDADAVRRHLLEHHDTGVVSLARRYVRLAHCSVRAEALPELVRRVEQGIRDLAGR